MIEQFEMGKITRRKFNKLMGALGTGSALETLGRGPTLLLAAERHVVVIGGGFGGAILVGAIYKSFIINHKLSI